MPWMSLGWLARQRTRLRASASGTPAPAVRNKAFISYSRGNPGEPWALWLQSRLERFPVPRPYRKNGEARIRPVFLDVNDASARGEVQAMLNAALDASDHLVVVCDTKTPSSNFVPGEISRFCRQAQEGLPPGAPVPLDRVSALLVESEVDPTFASLGFGSPAGSDVRRLEGHPWGLGRGVRSSQQRCSPPCRRLSCWRRRRAALVRIAAAIIGCDYDDLVKRVQRRQRRQLATATIAIVLVAIAGWQYVTLRHRFPQLAASATERLDSKDPLPLDRVAPLLTDISWLQAKQAGWRWFLLPGEAVYHSVPRIDSLARMLTTHRFSDIKIGGNISREMPPIGSPDGREMFLLTTNELIYLRAPGAEKPLEVTFRTTIPEPLGWNAVLTSSERRAVVVESREGRIVATTYDFRDPARPEVREHDTPAPEGKVARAAVGGASLSEVVLLAGDGLHWWTLGSTAEPLAVPASLSETTTMMFCPGSDRAIVVDENKLYISRTAAPGSPTQRRVEPLPAGLKPVCSGDGRRMAIVSQMRGAADHVLFVDLATGTIVGRAGSRHTIDRIAVGADGSQLVAMTPNGLSIWSQRAFTDADISWDEDFSVGPVQASHVAFVGSQLAAAADGSAIRLIDLATGQMSPVFSGLGGRIVEMLSGERITVVSRSDSGGGTIRLSTLMPIRRTGPGWYLQTRTPVEAAALSDHDTVLYPRLEGGLWSCRAPASCDEVQLLAGQMITNLDVSPDGRWAGAISASDDSARLMLMARPSTQWVEHASVVVPVDAPYAVATNGRLAWRSAAGRLIVRQPAGSFVECSVEGEATAMTFGFDDLTLAVALSDRTIRVGRITASCPEWTQRVTLPAQAGAVSRLRYSADGRTIFAIDGAGGAKRSGSSIWIVDLRAWIWPVRSRIDWPKIVDVRSDASSTHLRLLAATDIGALVLDSSDWKF